jgi:hypothetical protein
MDLGSVKTGELLDQMSNCKLSRKILYHGVRTSVNRREVEVDN